RLLQSLAGERQVTLETHLSPLPTTICFPAKINLMVQSLITNGIDACSAGGRVLIETKAIEDEIGIRVSENGTGSGPAIRDRIFDPFFTTKPIGQGTGLGLSISYGIVKDHGGMIDCQSLPGEGTRFTIRMPRLASGKIANQWSAADD